MQVVSALGYLYAVYHPSANWGSVAEAGVKEMEDAEEKEVLRQQQMDNLDVNLLLRLRLGGVAAPPLTRADSGYNSAVQSGYPSEDEDDNDCEEEEEDGGNELERLRADDFERGFATTWVKTLIRRVEEEGEEGLADSTDEVRQRVVESAAELLVALLNPPPPQNHEDEHSQNQKDEAEDDDKFTREFSFDVAFSLPKESKITVRVNDGLAGRGDHTDVGLQTWGASIVFCKMMCEDPGRFSLLLSSAPKIVELGAGTGLVSLVLGQLLPRLPAYDIANTRLVATDYHPAVIENLRENIAMNMNVLHDGAGSGMMPMMKVEASVLDWAHQTSWPLGEGQQADILFATDVIYGHEHAKLLYECASRLLKPEGVFWLLQTVRQNGRFSAVADTVEEVFGGEGGGGDENRLGQTQRLGIVERERLEKRSGVGRGDETFYKLFKIGWVEV